MRVHAALTALAFVLSSLFGLIHEGTTTHIRCAEHGELIDGGPAVASPASTGAAHAVRMANRAVGGGRAVIRDLELTIPRVAAVHHRDLYRTAPKTSPPV